MNIGFIGVGKIGSTLAERYAAAGHDVIIANSRGPSSLHELAEKIGAHAGTIQEAVAGADVVIISIPQKMIPELPKDLFAGSPNDLVIVETGNYMPHRDPPIDAIVKGMVESLWVQQQLGRPVIKAFNSIMAESLLNLNADRGSPERIALPVAGDDVRAKRIVMDLVDLAGFDPYDAGPLDESWRQQPGMPGYCTDLTLSELPAALAKADRVAGPGIRDAFARELLQGWEKATAADRIAIIRSYHF